MGFVKALAEAAGVPEDSVRDLGGDSRSVSLSANDLGAPGQVQTGTTAQSMIDVPAAQVSEYIVHWLANDTTKARLAQEIGEVPNVQAAVATGWPITQSDILIAVRRQNEQAFATIDSNHDGNLNYDEFHAAGQAFNPPLNDDEAHYAFEGLDVNHNSRLNPLEFEGYGLQHFGGQPNALAQSQAALPAVAPATQQNADAGPITVAEFRSRMGEASPGEVFNTLDATGDGVLDLDEFVVGGRAFGPPALDSTVAEYVFRGLDANSDDVVTRAEYDQVLASGQFAFSQRRLAATERLAKQGLRGRFV